MVIMVVMIILVVTTVVDDYGDDCVGGHDSYGENDHNDSDDKFKISKDIID